MCPPSPLWMASRTVFGPTQHGWVRFRFHGTGGELFVKFLVGYLLTLITFGIYASWFMCDLGRWFLERAEGVAEDGTQYQAQLSLTGGQLFVTILVNYLLTLITFGIYASWAICKIRTLVDSHLHLFENGEHVGGFQFIGEGGQFFVLALVQGLLCAITLYIYLPWAVVKFTQFFMQNSRVYYRDRWFQGDFTGTGGQLFVLNLVGLLLTQLTLGIYAAWYFAKKQAFETDNKVWYELTG